MAKIYQHQMAETNAKYRKIKQTNQSNVPYKKQWNSQSCGCYNCLL